MSLNLNLNVNKLVVYKNESLEFKGFLLKEGQSFNIKIIEVISGGYYNAGDTFLLNDKEQQYLVESAYPKLMEVSMKSWHYKLVKRVLGNSAPTPKNMHNGCPYFWLLVYSLFAIVFIAIFNVFAYVVNAIGDGLNSIMDAMIDSWLKGLENSEIYDYSYGGGWNFKPSKLVPFIRTNKYEKLERYIDLKYNVKPNTKEFSNIVQKLNDEWIAWCKASQVANNKRYDKAIVAQKAKRLSDAKWEKRMSPIKNIFSSIGKSISESIYSFTDKFRGNANIIKRTKQIAGLMLTLFMLACTLMIVSMLSVSIVWLIEQLSGMWTSILMVLGYMLIMVAIGGILFLMYSYIAILVTKVNFKLNSWYGNLLFNIYKPFAYLIKYTALTFYYILILPIKFIAFDFFFKIICVKIIANSFIKLFNVGCDSVGIFGEYFKASYSDYCPGIEWVDVDDDKN